MKKRLWNKFVEISLTGYPLDNQNFAKYSKTACKISPYTAYAYCSNLKFFCNQQSTAH